MAELGGQRGFRFRNWAGTYGCSPELFFRPRSVQEIRQILALARRDGKRVKVVGGGHSPSDIACSDGFLIHMGHFNRLLQVDKERLEVKVEAGILLSELSRELEKHGLALENLGAVSEVTAAGVIGTGTHNTGIELGILPTQVVAVGLLLASGEALECSQSQNPQLLGAARLHLGSLGVVLWVTFRCVPRFQLREVAFPATLDQVLEQLEQHLSRSRYFRFLWFPHSDNVRVIQQDPTQEPPRSSSSWFWDYAVGFHLLQFLLWLSSFFPGLVVWINRLFFRLLYNSRVEKVGPSHRIFSYECLFRQHVQDWAIPVGKTKEALLELRAALEREPGLAAHFPVEIRFCRRDAIPLSPCFQRDSCFINVIVYSEIPLSPCFQRDSCFINLIVYRPYGKEIPRSRYWLLYEGIMRRLGGRPHWAKAHSCTRKDFEQMYPEFPKFCAIREQLDPTGMFLNSYLEKVFY